jgi:hypothetical protein
MDEALIQMLVQLGAIPEEQALLMRQMDQGAGMMQTPGAQGQNVGGTYVASNPLEHLSVALQRGMGAQKQRGAEGAYRDTLGKQTAGRSAYAEALKRLMEQQMTGQAQPMPGPWDTGYVGG